MPLPLVLLSFIRVGGTRIMEKLHYLHSYLGLMEFTKKSSLQSNNKETEKYCISEKNYNYVLRNKK